MTVSSGVVAALMYNNTQANVGAIVNVIEPYVGAVPGDWREGSKWWVVESTMPMRARWYDGAGSYDIRRVEPTDSRFLARETNLLPLRTGAEGAVMRWREPQPSSMLHLCATSAARPFNTAGRAHLHLVASESD